MPGRFERPLPDLPVQYVDFCRAQDDRLHTEAMEAQLAFWRDQLGGAPPLLEFPTDHARPTVQAYRGSRVRRRLPDGAAEAVAGLSARHGVTPYMTYLAVFATLLHRYSGSDDIVIGSPIAGRNRCRPRESGWY